MVELYQIREFLYMGNLKLSDTIKMVITDFDGVVTDNCVYISDDFKMSRRLNFKDIMAFSILKKHNYMIGIISGEKNAAIEILAKKFVIEEVHQNIRVKIDVLKEIEKKYNLTGDEFLYIGDDINDIECLEYAKYKITVPHAVDKVKGIKGIQVTQNEAGSGAFREVADCLIK